jgi:hypothetical protein
VSIHEGNDDESKPPSPPISADRILHELRDNDEYGWANAITLIEGLLRWQAEAMKVLVGWDKVYAALDPEDAPLGEMRSSIALRAVETLKGRVQNLSMNIASIGDLVEYAQSSDRAARGKS